MQQKSINLLNEKRKKKIYVDRKKESDLKGEEYELFKKKKGLPDRAWF